MSKRQRLFRAAIIAISLTSTSFAGLSRTLAEPQEQPAVTEIEIVVEGGYKPNRIEVHEGERVRLKFIRKEYNSCTREVLFPKLGIRRELPPNQVVIIDLPALTAGEYEFTCGMNMIRGTLMVTAHAH
jgi:plastocyanin domain-containing protein